jgi:hypothetical protein
LLKCTTDKSNVRKCHSGMTSTSCPSRISSGCTFIAEEKPAVLLSYLHFLD